MVGPLDTRGLSQSQHIASTDPGHATGARVAEATASACCRTGSCMSAWARSLRLGDRAELEGPDLVVREHAELLPGLLAP
jgi:hypothetical protein